MLVQLCFTVISNHKSEIRFWSVQKIIPKPRWAHMLDLSMKRKYKLNGPAVHKALVLSHEKAEDDTIDSYLASMLFPMRPVVCWGRSATAEPRCDPCDAIWYWFKDLLGPSQSIGNRTLEASIWCGHVQRCVQHIV